MSELVVLDKHGRIEIPLHLREAMSLVPEQQLEVRFEGNVLTVRPTANGTILEQNGMYVWTGAVPDTDLVQEVREARLDSVFGQSK